MRQPVPRPEQVRTWHRSDDHRAAFGPPDAPRLASDRRPGLPLDQRPQNRRSVASAQSRVPLRRKRPAGTRGSGDIDEPSAVTGRARSIGDHALSEIDAPGPRLTPTCGGRTRRPRTEEWPLPDDHPRSRCQLGALDPRSPITEEGSTQSLSLRHAPCLVQSMLRRTRALARSTGPGAARRGDGIDGGHRRALVRAGVAPASGRATVAAAQPATG